MSGNYITADPAVMMGKPVLKGTRITVEFVLEKMAAGKSVEEIINAHPKLTREMVLAAVEYAVRVLKSDVVHVPPVTN